MKEVLDAIVAYGLPGWAIILVGGGTIVAAAISALQAIVVAAISARSNRVTAIDTAHREHRLSIARPILEYVRRSTTVASEISMGTAGSPDEIVVRSRAWLQQLKKAEPHPRIWVTDADLSAVLKAFNDALRDLKQALSRYADASPPDDRSGLERAARSLLGPSATVEMAVEGYAFGVSRISRQAKRRLQRATGQRWITSRGHRYQYWPLRRARPNRDQLSCIEMSFDTPGSSIVTP